MYKHYFNTYKDVSGASDLAVKQLLISELLKGASTEISEEDEKGNKRVKVPAVYNMGVGFDTESSQIVKQVRKGKKVVPVVTACWCYSYQLSFGASDICYDVVYRYQNHFLKFLKDLEDCILTANEMLGINANCIIWVANLAHEFSFLKQKLIEHFKFQKIFAKSAHDVLYFKIGHIEFRECIGLFGHSLAHIAETWSTTQKAKGELDYSLIRCSDTPLTENDLHYIHNDTRPLAEMHVSVMKAYLQETGAFKVPFTATGFVRLKVKEAIRNNEALSETKDKFNSHSKKYKMRDNINVLTMKHRKQFINEYEHLLFRFYSYSGGLSGSNIVFVGTALKHVKCADITSDYPFQFISKQYPEGKLEKGNKKLLDYYRSMKKPFYIVLRLKNIESKNDHAVYSRHKILNSEDNNIITEFGMPKDDIYFNGKVYKGKNIVVCWNDVDLSAYEKQYTLEYDEADIIDIYVFERYAYLPSYLTLPMMKDYVNKDKLKKEGLTDTLEYKDSKRDINSYYGLTAQQWQDILDKINEETFLMTNSKSRSFKYNKSQCYLPPHSATWCTSYARKTLIDIIADERFTDAIVQYDTDSLYFRADTPEGKALEKFLIETNTIIVEANKRRFKNYDNKEYLYSIGTWDFEPEYKNFIGFGAKKYIKEELNKKTGEYEIKTVIAGLPKKAIPEYIKRKGIKNPFTHFNVVEKYMKENCADIIIEHLFTNKFTSVYNDTEPIHYIDVTDYQGNTYKQETGMFHAILPADFTLGINDTFLKHVLEMNPEYRKEHA